MADEHAFSDLNQETEARWRLVETGWELSISSQLIGIEYDDDTKGFYANEKERRINITSSRDSLNGYQNGKCFYCYNKISINPSDDNLTEVDHFIPWKLKGKIPNINGVWNLVLSCEKCNRGVNGKFEKLPTLELLKRLARRNEYLISSYLPLRETLIRQTGSTPQTRQKFLQTQYNTAKINLIHTWEPFIIRGIITF